MSPRLLVLRYRAIFICNRSLRWRERLNFSILRPIRKSTKLITEISLGMMWYIGKCINLPVGSDNEDGIWVCFSNIIKFDWFTEPSKLPLMWGYVSNDRIWSWFFCKGRKNGKLNLSYCNFLSSLTCRRLNKNVSWSSYLPAIIVTTAFEILINTFKKKSKFGWIQSYMVVISRSLSKKCKNKTHCVSILFFDMMIIRFRIIKGNYKLEIMWCRWVII